MTYDEYRSLNADEKMQARAQSLRTIALASGFDLVYDADSSEVIAKKRVESALGLKQISSDQLFQYTLSSYALKILAKTNITGRNPSTGRFGAVKFGKNASSPSKKRLKKTS